MLHVTLSVVIARLACKGLDAGWVNSVLSKKCQSQASVQAVKVSVWLGIGTGEILFGIEYSMGASGPIIRSHYPTRHRLFVLGFVDKS